MLGSFNTTQQVSDEEEQLQPPAPPVGMQPMLPAPPQAQPEPAPEAPPQVPAAPTLGPDYGTEAGIQREQQGELDLTQQATQKGYEADRKEAAAEGAAAVDKKRQLEAHAHEVGKIVAERDKVVGAQVAKVQQLADQARNTKIDPKGAWHDANALQKVSGVLGLALGGLLVAHGTRNPAEEMINRTIQRNIDAQRANLDNLNQGVQNQESILGELRQQFRDKTAAENAMHGILLDQIANDLDGKLAGVKDLKAQQRGLELSAKLRGQAAEMHAEAQKREADATDRAFDHEYKKQVLGEQVAQRRQQGYIAGRELALKARDQELEATKLGLTAAETERKAQAEADGKSLWFKSVRGGAGDDGHRVQIDDATQRDKVTELVSSAEEGINAVATLRAIMNSEGRTEFNDADKKIAEAEQAKIIFAAVKASGQGRNPSDSDVKRATKLAGGTEDPTAWWSLLSVKERNKVLTYVEDSTRKNANRTLQSISGGKATFDYKGEALLRHEAKVGVPSFDKVRKGVVDGTTPAASLLDTNFQRSGRPQKALALLSERASKVQAEFKKAPPARQRELQKELAELGRVANEIQKRAGLSTRGLPGPAGARGY